MAMIIDPYTWHRLKIESKTDVASDTIAIRFTRPKDYAFKAGQYAVVRVMAETGQPIIRQYSFSSSPNDDQLELLIQREPEGVVTSWFHTTAQIGDEVELSQPFGNFVIDSDTARPLVCIAGRVGIAPFVSMMRDASSSDIALLYSVRDSSQVCFLPLLQKFQTTIVQTASSPRIDDHLLRGYIANDPLIYVCGSKQFVDAVTESLRRIGAAPESIRRELFTLQ